MDKKKNFEKAIKELELIAQNLEDGELDLDKSINEFEKGIKLAKFCHDKLEEAERKIEVLQSGENNEVKNKKVKIKIDTGEVDNDDELQGSLL